MIMRDVKAEMKAIFESEMAGGDPLPLVAQRVVEKLRATDPELLAAWLDLHAEGFIRDAMDLMDRVSRRPHAPRTQAQEAMRKAVERSEQGDVAPLVERLMLDAWYKIDEAGVRLRLRDMRREHLTFQAKAYGAKAKALAFEQAFMQALAEKVGDKTVGEVFTEAQLAEMRIT